MITFIYFTQNLHNILYVDSNNIIMLHFHLLFHSLFYVIRDFHINTNHTYLNIMFSLPQTEHSYKAGPKLLQQLQYCEENLIPLAVVIGQSEIEKGVVKVRVVSTREEVRIRMIV